MKKEKSKEFNRLILLAGARGAGKTTIAEKLCEKYNWKILPTYTTRPKRSEDEQGHIFLTSEEFDQIPEEERLAYTEHYGDRYCTTAAQLEDYDIFIIDIEGIRYFKREYKGKKEIFSIYLDITAEEQRKRLEERGETPENIIKYLERDKELSQNEDLQLTIGVSIINENIDDTISKIESYIFQKSSKKSLSDRILIWRTGVAMKAKHSIDYILNWYERFWRKEAIKEIRAKIKKSSSPELEERLNHEIKMLNIVEFNRVTNNLDDIFRNAKERKWY